MTIRKAVTLAALLFTVSCATPQRVAGPTHSPATPCPAEIASTKSRAGQVWWHENRWRFATDEAADAAYRQLAEGASPWPDWYTPYETTLAPGTRFQMAIGGQQTPEMPGSFGTFDQIRSVSDVRDFLAVRLAWKPQVDRVVTYEVVKPVPVKIGPVGPQVDPDNCALLEGRWSQFQAKVERGTFITYLKIIDVHPIP